MMRDRAEQLLEQRITGNPDDAVAHYRLGVLLLASRDLYKSFGPDTTGAAARAEQLLRRAVDIDPTHARARATLGFALHQLSRLDEALACFRAARRLDPKNETYDVYVPTLLAALDREEDALAEIARVGRRRKANLAKVKRELAAAKFPADADTLLLNAFIRAYNFMWSWLSDEAERVRNSLTRGRKQRLAKAEKAKLIVTADRLSEKANAWLDTFPSGEMSVEAAAFMYLMSGIEKIRR